MKKFFLFLSIYLLVSGMISAHEFFVITDKKNLKSGDAVPLYLLSTHYFNVGEELEDLKYNKVYVRQNGVRGNPLPLKTNNAKIWYETEFRLQSDAPVIIEGDRSAAYTCVFSDGARVEGDPDTVKKANPGKTLVEIRFLHKVSKTYLNPNTNDTTFSTPLGYALEIIPLNNPAELRRGSNAQFRVLYNAKPLANADIWATYDQYDSKTMNAHEQTGKTDRNGEIAFKISNPGVWIIGLRNTAVSTLQGSRLTENNDSIVVFTVSQ